MKLPGLNVEICPFEEAVVGDYVIPTITYEEARLIGLYSQIPDSELKTMFISAFTQVLKIKSTKHFVTTVAVCGFKTLFWWISPNHCVIVRKKDATPEKLKEVMCYLMLKK